MVLGRIAGFAAALLLAAAGFATLAGDDDLCGNRIIERAFSTDGQRIAYVFVRDCGATTGFSTNIAIGALRARPEDADIVFTADDDHGAAETDGSAIWLRVAWTGPRTLSVAYAEHAHLYNSVGRMGDATINYRASSRFAPAPPSARFPENI